jgi:hypothetical protein
MVKVYLKIYICPIIRYGESIFLSYYSARQCYQISNFLPY